MGGEVLFCNIGGVICSVNKHMIPRLVFRRRRRGHFAIPLIRPLKIRINIVNQATIAKTVVINLLANKKFDVQTFLSRRFQ